MTYPSHYRTTHDRWAWDECEEPDDRPTLDNDTAYENILAREDRERMEAEDGKE